jgi:hypothetical protein
MKFGILHIHKTEMKDGEGMWKNMAGLRFKTFSMGMHYVITPIPLHCLLVQRLLLCIHSPSHFSCPQTLTLTASI